MTGRCVAEEVEKVNPDLGNCDRDGKVQTMCYGAVNATFLKEFLKECRRVKEQGAATSFNVFGFLCSWVVVVGQAMRMSYNRNSTVRNQITNPVGFGIAGSRLHAASRGATVARTEWRALPLITGWGEALVSDGAAV